METKICRNITIDSNTWRQLGKAAIDQGTSRSALVRRAVSQFLDGSKPERGVKKWQEQQQEDLV